MADDTCYFVRFTLVGDDAVGKSSLLSRFVHNTFTDDYTKTIGVEFGVRDLAINGKKVKVQLWDLAGGERFRDLCASYYRRSNVIILVYDVSNGDSFAHMQRWIDEIEPLIDSDSTFFTLVGNKDDENNSRAVSSEEGARFAKEKNIIFYETSAKTGKNVEEAFTALVEPCLEKDHCDKRQQGITVSDPPRRNAKCC